MYIFAYIYISYTYIYIYICIYHTYALTPWIKHLLKMNSIWVRNKDAAEIYTHIHTSILNCVFLRMCRRLQQLVPILLMWKSWRMNCGACPVRVQECGMRESERGCISTAPDIYVCIYTYIYICILHICVYICDSICLCLRLCAYMSMCMYPARARHLSKCVCTYTHMHTHVCICNALMSDA